MNIQSNRISNALPAAENQFPYAISLQKLSEIQSTTRGHRCGGALISLEHALTAASCTFDNNNGVFSPINPAEYRVFVGSVRLTNDTSPDRTRNVSFISVHPMHNMSAPYVNDIAVITLISRFPENAVTIVRLSVPSADPFYGSCTVAGWGAQSISASASTQLMYLQKTIYSLDRCTTLFGNLNYTVGRNMICATSGQTVASGCAGDVGNPLVCENGGPHDILLTGLLTITKNCIASENPEVYSRVSTYYQWILVAMTYLPPGPAPGAASTFQPGLAMLTIFALIQVYRSCAK